jgi:hypothetical protein
MLAEVP